MSISRKEGFMWGGAVIVAVAILGIVYGWVISEEEYVPEAEITGPAGATGGGDD